MKRINNIEAIQNLMCKSLEDHDFASSECKDEIVEMAMNNVKSNSCEDYYNALLIDIIRRGLNKEEAIESLKSLKDICPEYFL